MDSPGFDFGRRAQDQIDLVRALSAQGKIDRQTATVQLNELSARLRAAQACETPQRRWGDSPAEVARSQTVERRRRLLARVRGDAMPVRLAGLLRSAHGSEAVPLVHVDGRRRPDVADLPRVFRLEDAEAQARSRWLFVLDVNAGGCGVLVVSVRRPVHCRFRLVFSLLHDRSLLGIAARAGGFALTCVDPARDEERAVADAMFVAVPSEDILTALSATGHLAA